MKPSIYSLLIVAALTVTGIHQASAKNLSNDKHTEATALKGEPTFKGSENFVKSFPNALVESCETTAGFTKVKFSWNGDALEAFYDDKGSLIATSHFVDVKALPLTVRMNIKNDYADYWIFQAVEFYHTENGLSYFVIIKKDDKAVILQADANGTLAVVKKMKN